MITMFQSEIFSEIDFADIQKVVFVYPYLKYSIWVLQKLIGRGSNLSLIFSALDISLHEKVNDPKTSRKNWNLQPQFTVSGLNFNYNISYVPYMVLIIVLLDQQLNV